MHAPEWPLPPDVLFHEPENFTEHPFYVQCNKCFRGLHIPPNDTGGMRRHTRSLGCRKDTEQRLMNEQGYYRIFNYRGFENLLKPYQKTGKFYNYFTAPVASFMRWKDGGKDWRTKAFASEVAAFLSLSPTAQEAHLAGHVLAKEYSREDGGESSFGEEDLPF